MKKSILIIGFSIFSITSFGQTTKSDTTITKNLIKADTYTEDMKDEYHRELAISMSKWDPERVTAFKKLFVYTDFTPVSRDTIIKYMPEYKTLD